MRFRSAKAARGSLLSWAGPSRSDNYRKATQKAIDGEWKQFRPTEFFDNVLLTGSAANIEKTAGRLGSISETDEPEAAELERPKIIVPQVINTGPLVTGPLANPQQAGSEAAESPEPQAAPQIGATAELVYAFYQAAVNAGMGGAPPPEKRTGNPEIAVWRSLFGTLMQKDYQSCVLADTAISFRPLWPVVADVARTTRR